MISLCCETFQIDPKSLCVGWVQRWLRIPGRLRGRGQGGGEGAAGPRGRH